MDVVFVLDGSQSVGYENWTKIKKIVVDFITAASKSASQARFGVVVYSSGVATDGIIPLAQSDSILLNKVQYMRYPSQGTYTDKGIDEAKKMFAKFKIDGVPQIMIVITDGLSYATEKTADSANAARQVGIDIYAVGISTALSPISKRKFTRELLAIASVQSKVAELANFGTLSTSVLTQLTPVCVGTSGAGKSSFCFVVFLYCGMSLIRRS